MLNATISQMLRATPAALTIFTLMTAPLLAVGSVRASDENIIEHIQQQTSGAGLVLMVSLQRAH